MPSDTSDSPGFRMGGDPFEHYVPGAQVRRSSPNSTRLGTIISTRGFGAMVLWDGDKKPSPERLMALSWVAPTDHLSRTDRPS